MHHRRSSGSGAISKPAPLTRRSQEADAEVASGRCVRTFPPSARELCWRTEDGKIEHRQRSPPPRTRPVVVTASDIGGAMRQVQEACTPDAPYARMLQLSSSVNMSWMVTPHQYSSADTYARRGASSSFAKPSVTNLFLRLATTWRLVAMARGKRIGCDAFQRGVRCMR